MNFLSRAKYPPIGDPYSIYRFPIARGHIWRADKFPGKLHDCLTIGFFNSSCNCPGVVSARKMCPLACWNLYGSKNAWMSDRQWLCPGDKKPACKCTQSTSHTPPAQAPSHSPPTQAATLFVKKPHISATCVRQIRHVCQICPTVFGRISGRWISYMTRILTIFSGFVSAGLPVIFGGPWAWKKVIQLDITEMVSSKIRFV